MLHSGSTTSRGRSFPAAAQLRNNGALGEGLYRREGAWHGAKWHGGRRGLVNRPGDDEVELGHMPQPGAGRPGVADDGREPAAAGQGSTEFEAH